MPVHPFLERQRVGARLREEAVVPATEADFAVDVEDAFFTRLDQFQVVVAEISHEAAGIDFGSLQLLPCPCLPLNPSAEVEDVVESVRGDGELGVCRAAVFPVSGFVLFEQFHDALHCVVDPASVSTAANTAQAEICVAAYIFLC